MRQLIHVAASIAIVALLSVASGFASSDGQQPAERVNPHAAVLADFQKRIETYRKLHDEVAKGPAELKTTKDPAEIRKAQQTLAARLRTARANARQGDIFTPDIRSAFRRLMYPEVTGPDGAETKAAIKEDAPRKITLKVNASYPEGEPLPTVPPNLLANLPRLPEDLEYRIVDRHLVLLDVDANLIVDFIPNAIR